MDDGYHKLRIPTKLVDFSDVLIITLVFRETYNHELTTGNWE